ncbi:MAG TPA: alpha/beta hydrolase [Coriobacteriia bacterium]
MSIVTDGHVTATDGRQIGYRIRGDRALRPLLCLHGQPGARLEADITLPDEVLTQFGVFVVSVDRPGYGLSDPKPVEDMTLGSADIISVADHLEIGAFPVMGFSAGCPHALALAATYPERVQRVALASMAGPQDDDRSVEGMEQDQLDEVRLLRAGRLEEVAPSYDDGVATFLGDAVAELTLWFESFPREEREWFREPRVTAAFAADVREAVRQGSEGWLRESLVRILPWSFDLQSIHAPVRAFHGELDTWGPLANAEGVLAALPNAALRVYPGANHLGPRMHPEDLLGAAVA